MGGLDYVLKDTFRGVFEPNKYGGKNRKKCTIFDAASLVRGMPFMTKYASTATNPEAKLIAMMEICAVLWLSNIME